MTLTWQFMCARTSRASIFIIKISAFWLAYYLVAIHACKDTSCLHLCHKNVCILIGLLACGNSFDGQFMPLCCHRDVCIWLAYWLWDCFTRNYKLLHGFTHFYTELQSNCTANQPKSSNFFVYMIIPLPLLMIEIKLIHNVYVCCMNNFILWFNQMNSFFRHCSFLGIILTTFSPIVFQC